VSIQNPLDWKSGVWENADKDSFAGTGFVSVAIAWFILPEVTRRTPGEIDEL